MSARNSTPERSGQGPLCVSAALHGGDLDALPPPDSRGSRRCVDRGILGTD